MKKFKVWAKYSTYCWLDVEAETKQEAEEIAENTDEGKFEQEKDAFDDGGWQIVNNMTEEING